MHGPQSPGSGLAIVLERRSTASRNRSYSACRSRWVRGRASPSWSRSSCRISQRASPARPGSRRWLGRRRIIRLWVIVVVASAIAAFVGATLLAGGQGELRAFILGFAAGRSTMLTDTLRAGSVRERGEPGRPDDDAWVRARVRAVAARLGAAPDRRQRAQPPACSATMPATPPPLRRPTAAPGGVSRNCPIEQDAEGHEQHDRGDRVGRRASRPCGSGRRRTAGSSTFRGR